VRNKLFVTYVTNISQLPQGLADEFFTCFEKIFSRKPISRTLRFLCTFKAATASTIGRALPEYSIQAIYRALGVLNQMGLVLIPHRGTAKRWRRGGPKPKIYAIFGYDPTDITAAMEQEALTDLPGHVSLEKITQLIIDDYVQPRNLEWLEQKWVKYYLDKHAEGYYSKHLLSLVKFRLEHVHGLKVMV